jgi:hypothetical protein
MFWFSDPPSKCNPWTCPKKIIYYTTVLVYTVIKYCYKYTFEIVLLFTLLNSIKTSTTIDNPSLRLGIITCCAIITILRIRRQAVFFGLVDAENKALKIKKTLDELKEMKELESRINGSLTSIQKNKLKRLNNYWTATWRGWNMMGKVGLSGVGDIRICLIKSDSLALEILRIWLIRRTRRRRRNRRY